MAMQYSDRTVQVVETYVAKFPLGTIHLDGLGSPEIGRRIIIAGREKLQEKIGDNVYVDITSTKSGKPANYLLNTPSTTFIQTLDNKIYERELSEAVVQALKEYLGDKTPVTNTQDVEWKPHKEEEPAYDQYSGRWEELRRQGFREPGLSELPTFLGIGTAIFNDSSKKPADVSNLPYESINGLVYAHSDTYRIYVVERNPTAEQAVELLSQRAGWRLSRNGSKPQNIV